jgi:potassium-transporting ATPase KdpC subunit
MIRQAKSAFLMVLAMTVLTGVVYPLAVTGLAQAFFHRQASGSLIPEGGTPAGSDLIGQPFSSPSYFWGRPSATPGRPYNGALSGGSNLGPTNPELLRQVEDRIRALRDADPGNTAPVPVDLVTASGSGLDPHISPAAAYFQARRVARARGLAEGAIQDLIARHLRGRQFGLLGEPVVNVLELNRALDHLSVQPAPVS